MAPAIRLAIVGCGAIVEERYVPALRRMRWLPTALVDISEKRRHSVVDKLGTSAIQADQAKDCLDAFDAAIVSVPNALHAKLCIELLRSGKHVLVEKPMAINVNDCAAMNRQAVDSGRRLAVNLPRRQDLCTRWLKEALEKNALSKPHRFTIREGHEFAWPLTTDALWRKEQAGGGVLIDTGSHTLDEVIWWFGEPIDIDYYDDADGGTEANCLIRMRWQSGLEGEIELTRTRTLSNSLQLECESGWLSLKVHTGEFRGSPGMLDYCSPRLGKPPFRAIDPVSQFRDQLAQFQAYIRDGLANIVTGEEAARSVALIKRCYALRRRLELPWIHYAHASRV
jgi:predicted dehydrogenase